MGLESPPSLCGGAAFWRVNFNWHILEVKMRMRMGGGDSGGGRRADDGNEVKDGDDDRWRSGGRCRER